MQGIGNKDLRMEAATGQKPGEEQSSAKQGGWLHEGASTLLKTAAGYKPKRGASRRNRAGGKPKTLEEVGKKFGVTRERIRQLQNIALAKLRRALSKKEKPIEILRIDESVRVEQTKQLRKLRSERSSEEVARQLASLRDAAQGTENLMPHIYAPVKAYATLGEICDSLRDVFGTHEEASVT